MEVSRFLFWMLAPGSYGPVVLWSYGPMVLWSYGPVVLWSYGPVVLWACGPVGLWSYGPMVLWSYGPMVLWSYRQVLRITSMNQALSRHSRLKTRTSNPLIHRTSGPQYRSSRFFKSKKNESQSSRFSILGTRDSDLASRLCRYGR